MSAVKFYGMAALSEASYVLFDKLDGFFSDDSVKRVLLKENNEEFNGEFSGTQAADFVSKWSVTAHTPNTNTGYSSTVFKSKTGSDYVLAFRGTEPSNGGDLIADGDIVTDGLAIWQIVDMYNDIQRLRAASGTTYSTATLELDVLATDRLSNAAHNPVLYEQVKAELLARTDLIFDGMAVYNVVLSDVTATEDGALKDAASITVTGHSLGGHLAAAASRLFPSFVKDVLTFNGAGFSPATEGFKHVNVCNLFALLGGAAQFDEGKIQNLYGERGYEVVTQDSPFGLLAQPGKHEGIYIEALFGQAFGHGKGQMTDALAVYDLFIQADSRLQAANAETAMAVLNPIFEGASNNTNATFETLLNALGHLFVGTAFPIVETGALRDTFYASVQQIKGKLGTGSLLVESLVGKTSGDLITQAKTDIAARYALVHLNPFIITGNDDLYDQHNSKGEIGLFDPTTGQGLSEQYLKDRAKFLALKNELAVADRPWQETIPSDMRGYYEDRGSQFSINNTYNATRVPAAEYIFGTDNADVIESFRDPGVPEISFDDHMFGGGGNDIIRTHGGNDYLEGGLGDDILDGGAGDDTMAGGEGVDTYYIQGNDRIIDEGKNNIFYNGLLIAGTFAKINDSTYAFTADDGSIKHLSFQSPGVLTFSATDSITFDLQTSGAAFADNDFGFVLQDTAPTSDIVLNGNNDRNEMGIYMPSTNPSSWELYLAAFPAGSGTGVFIFSQNLPATAPRLTVHGEGAGDFLFGFQRHDELFGGDGDDIIGGDTVLWNGHAIALSGGAEGDMLDGGAGKDFLSGSGEADLILGGSGNDFVDGRNGADDLRGGDGNDLVVGASQSDFLSGGEGDDLLVGDGYLGAPTGQTFNLSLAALQTLGLSFASGSAGYHTGYTTTNIAVREAPNGGDDVLNGGGGQDMLYGGAGNDVLAGGSGHDALSGDEGADYLDGGGGNDLLLGGEGDDALLGDTDDDQLQGGSGHDVLSGGDGLDELFGEAGDDTLYGGADQDSLYGGMGGDFLEGGDDADYLSGWSEADTLSGGRGDDTVCGDDGADVLFGGEGKDTLVGGTGNDSLHGDGGNDELQGEVGNDTLAGGSGVDLLFGQEGNDALFGNGESDTLDGGAGDDFLEGGDGDDVLIGGAGINVLAGGAGRDVYRPGPSGRDTIIDADGYVLEIDAALAVSQEVVTTWADGTLNICFGQGGHVAFGGFATTGMHGVASSIVVGGGYDGIRVPLGGFGFGGSLSPVLASAISAMPLDVGAFISMQSTQMHLFDYLASIPGDNQADYFSASAAVVPPVRWDPLILDLDGDGVETVRMSLGRYFDHDTNGFAERSAWVGADDALLARDLDGDGKIGNGAELFGDNTMLSNGQWAPTGFAALADLDSNGDGVINASDTIFAELLLWKDENGDALSAPEELHTLVDMDIQEIRLEHSECQETDASGNTKVGQGEFIRNDDVHGVVAEYQLQTDRTQTVQTTAVSVSADIASLPWLAGAGNVGDLHQSIARDQAGTLRSVVEAFIAAGSEAVRSTLLDDILVTWVGAADVASNSRGGAFDGRKLAVIEGFMGQAFAGAGGAVSRILVFPDQGDELRPAHDANTSARSVYAGALG